MSILGSKGSPRGAICNVDGSVLYPNFDFAVLYAIPRYYGAYEKYVPYLAQWDIYFKSFKFL